jgi:chemotaxis family two-component system sensor kinase Cph1
MSITLQSPDLSSCDREVIHAPGAIQPHGMMLVVGMPDLLLNQVAGEIESRLDVSEWLGHPLSHLVGTDLSADVAVFMESSSADGFVGQLHTKAGETLDMSAHVSGSSIIIELEASSTEGLPAARVMNRVAKAANAFERAETVAALCELAAVEFRRLSGFDRIMIYQFLDDDAGKVIAEDKRPDMHSFLNHHFPASDIPPQARALYVRNILRVIPNSSYEPVTLRPPVATMLDMSDSSLRSVSPMHLLYLQNMGVQASASFSIIRDGVLWGLVACHNETPRLLTYDVRAACHSLVGSLARQIKAKIEAEGYRQRIRLRGFEDDMVALLSREGSLDTGLTNHLDEIARMMAGDGIAVLRGRELVTSGSCPPDDEIQKLATWLVARPIETVFSTDRLSTIYPQAAVFQVVGSGVLSITLSADQPWLLIWFRAEQIEQVNWAGNPHKATNLDQNAVLTPRASFEAWSEMVRGQSRNWSLAEVEAAVRLRAALLDVQQNRRVLELNRQLTKILQDKDLLLQQKEFLIGEVNHRVQNSLQLVSAFLSLQGQTSNNVELQNALEEARRRLSAVALVHRRLYRGDQIEVVDAARYIEELCVDTFSFMGGDWTKHLTLDLSPVLVSTDRSVTLGLVLTELLINSNKYAYDGAAGPIKIELIEDRTHLRMTVSDKGIGRKSSRVGFGSRIMKGLIAQLGGEMVESDNGPGLRVAVIVPVQDPRQSEKRESGNPISL